MKIIAKKCDNTHDVFLYWWENNWAWKTIFCLFFRFRESLLSYCRWKTTFVDYYFSVLMYKFSTATFEPFSPLHGHSRPLTFHGHLTFSTATFEQSGRHHSHLATLQYQCTVLRKRYVTVSYSRCWQERGGQCFPVCTVVAAWDSNRRLHMAPPRPRGHGGRVVEV